MTNTKNFEKKNKEQSAFSTLKKNLDELKETFKTDKNEIVEILNRIENNTKNNNVDYEERPNISIQKKKHIEYRGLHLIWDNEKLLHWKGWCKNPNYDPVYSSHYTKVYYPDMDINNPVYQSYLNNTKIKNYVTGINYDDLPIGWKVIPSLIKEKRMKYANSEDEHNSKVYPYIANTTNLFQEMCNNGWIISKWCNNDPTNHFTDEKNINAFSYLTIEKKPPFPYSNGSDYSCTMPYLGSPNCIMEKYI